MIWTSTKHGYDVSYWQDNNTTPQGINFQTMRDSGASFVIIRTSYGATVDEDAAYNLQASKGILPRGVYHYWWNTVTPEAQADVVLRTIAGAGIEGRVWLDLETGGISSPPRWRRFCEIIEAAGYRVGIYTGYPWWKDHALTSGEDLSYFYARPLWQAWYTSNPANVLIAGQWSRMMIWQSGTPATGLSVGVESPTVDYDQWNEDYNFAAEWGNTELPQTYTKSRRYNSDVYTVTLSRWGRAHVTNTNGTRETVSSAARRLGAVYAVNADGWASNTPLSLAASDGKVYQSVQYDFRPFVNIGADNKVTITHVPMATPYNLASGTRYLVRDGVNQFNSSADPEHITERHPRTAIGVTATNGLILCVVDGRSIESAGVTVKELAEIMLSFGARHALEMDGGGSSALWVRDRVVNVPSDGAERPVINHVLIYEESQPMADYFEYTTTTSRRVRSGAGVQFPYALPDFTSKAKGGATAADRYTLPADVYSGTSVIGRKGDVWAKLYEVNGVNREGWTALVHLGVNQGIAERLVTVTPPPPPAVTVKDVIIKLAPGSTVTTVYSDGSQKVETA
jgi:GH25 family lysozyme M1 (1,4-beta-N-acetylmuramidase)